MSFLLLGLGIAHVNLLENNLRPTQDCESNPAWIRSIIQKIVLRTTGIEPIRGRLLASINLKNLRDAAWRRRPGVTWKRENQLTTLDQGSGYGTS
jgi:hypothetical protein